jgi:hypothetical protein
MELKRLKEQINENFISSSESKEPIVVQDFSDIHGMYTGQPVIGVIGGAITQIAIVLSAAIKHHEDATTEFFNRKSMTVFLHQFISNQMKFDYLNFLVSKNVV